MNIGAILFIGYLMYRFSQRNEGKDAPPATTAVSTEESSFRTITISVIAVVLYFAYLWTLMVPLEHYLKRITTSSFGNALVFTGCLVLPAVLVRCGPPWLAWRVVRLLRHPLPARFVFWFTPVFRKDVSAGFARLLLASCGRDPIAAEQPVSPFRRKLRAFFLMSGQPPLVFDAWTIAALAVYAEARGEPEQAKRYARALSLAEKHAVPRMVRTFAFELLVMYAAGRGDWQGVADRAAFGAGRAMPLYRNIARARITGRVNWVLLIGCWLLAPCRIAALPHLLALARRGEEARPHLAADESAGFTLADHLGVLQDVAEGRRVELARVIALAVTWQRRLTSESYGAMLARGMEVEARDPRGTIDAIPELLLAELEEMAAHSVGSLPEEVVEDWESWRETLAGAVVMRLRNRLFEKAEASAAHFSDDNSDEEETPPLPDCWERWLAMRDDTERLAALMGIDDLATAWFGGIRIHAWNGACRVHRAYGMHGAWLSYLMFSWVIKIAELLDDEEAVEVNRRNVGVCEVGAPTFPQSVWRLAGRAWRGLRDLGTSLGSARWWQTSLPRFGRYVGRALLSRITIALPVGGTVATFAALSAFWPLSDIVTGSLFMLPAVVLWITLLYVVALRIEKRVALEPDPVAGAGETEG